MKQQYALLRNNKQIGVFTLKEISQIELLSTDLVWVQAKSTVWLTPDQIDELKKYVKPVVKVEDAEILTSVSLGTPKLDVVEDNADKDSDTGGSKMATQVQTVQLFNEMNVTSKNETEESVDYIENWSEETTESPQVELSINESEIASKVEAEVGVQYDNANEKDQELEVTPNGQLLSDNEIEFTTETEAKEVSSRDTDGSRSSAAAHVILPQAQNSPVPLKTTVIEAVDDRKPSVTPYVIKPQKTFNTEGRVYVRFPTGVPHSLFYRTQKSVEDKLEIKAIEAGNTKVYAAKPNPRSDSNTAGVR